MMITCFSQNKAPLIDNSSIKFYYSLHKKIFAFEFLYSHLSNSRGGWNKRGGSAKVAKSINLEVGINLEGGIFFGKN